MNITRSNILILTMVLTSLKGACVAVAALMQYFLMAAFCWMLVEGIYLYLLVVKVYNIDSKMTIYHVLSWCKFLHYSHSRYYLPDRTNCCRNHVGSKCPQGVSQDLLHALHMQFNYFKISTILLTHLADDDAGKSSSFSTIFSSCKSVFFP